MCLLTAGAHCNTFEVSLNSLGRNCEICQCFVVELRNTLKPFSISFDVFSKVIFSSLLGYSRSVGCTNYISGLQIIINGFVNGCVNGIISRLHKKQKTNAYTSGMIYLNLSHR